LLGLWPIAILFCTSNVALELRSLRSTIITRFIAVGSEEAHLAALTSVRSQTGRADFPHPAFTMVSICSVVRKEWDGTSYLVHHRVNLPCPFRISPVSQSPGPIRLNEFCLRPHSADSTFSHLWPTGSSEVSPLDYGPILLLMPFGFRLTADTLPSLPVSLTFRAS